MVLSGTLHLQAQVFPIGMFNGQTITTCSGTFYDAGGNYAGYTFNEDYSITFCSSDPLNTHIKLYFTTFNVQAGDTLWSIAKRFEGVSVDDIRNANDIKAVHELKPGQVLKVPVKA